ncbi:LysR family pca operon transcriptional activator [Neorhizobium sp. 2083]|uniref:LysR family transcriptional regulator n=1 Tax=Neorhizobium sp. 2083 TaxID=2817762 RepID=UPI0028597644|nr:LysR substrate-binding domain-containing protein [Neorhizobium sp. 2083]MDR6820341.1 LysR family pca operon transcriptional activator [Neorhizobium sp. 2083]
MDLEPRLLRYLLAIDRAGSFQKAAEALGISQPALSVSIARLEDITRMHLVDRGRFGAILTDTGRILIRHAESIEAILQLAQKELEARRRGAEGPLRVGGTPLATGSILPRVIAQVLRESGSAAVTVTEGTDEELMARLLTHELDLVISNVGQRPTPEGVEEIPLFTARSVIVVRAGHPLAGRDRVSLVDLAGSTWVMPPPGGAFRKQIEALFTTNGIPFPANLVEAAPFSVLKAIVERSDGVSILSDQFLRDEIRRGILTAIPLAEHIATRQFAMQKIAGRQLNLLGQRFVSAARDLATETDAE